MGAEPEKMIFIVGMSRSGTTLLGRIIASSDCVYTFEELHFFEGLVTSQEIQEEHKVDLDVAKKIAIRLLTSAEKNIFEPSDNKRWESTAIEIIESISGNLTYGKIYINVLKWYANSKYCSAMCEQTPRYIFALDDVFKVFPNARVVNMVRDPRDVLLSQKNKWRTFSHGLWDMPLHEALRVWSNYSPIIQSLMWRSCVNRAETYLDDERILTVRFEDLVSSPEHTIKKICEHTFLNYSGKMLEVEKVGSSIKSDKKGEMGIDESYSFRWKQGGLSFLETSVCEFICGKQILSCNYDLERSNYRYIAFIFSVPSFLVKAIIALILNRNRSRSLLRFALNRLGV